MHVIKVENVSKIYKRDRITAVSNLSFEINEGEMFGLLGPNAAGKSTTFKMLTTLLHPTEGKIGIMGYDPEKNPQKIRSMIGYVAQDGGLDGGLTAYENLKWVAKLYRISNSDCDAKINSVLEAVGLQGIDKRPLGAYSGGMKRSLQIASALLHEPKILFLDEPSVGLDVDHRRKLWEVLQYLNKEKGITIFLTTHYLEEADKICDRVMIIDQGKCVCSGNPQYLKEQVGGDQIYFTLKPHSMQLSDEQFKKQLINEKRNVDIQQVQIDESNCHVRFWVDDGPRVIAEFVDMFKKSGLEVDSVKLSRPTLDDVMIQYTKRSLNV
jgi:ABC-2 type transport system ATP-binding protein